MNDIPAPTEDVGHIGVGFVSIPVLIDDTKVVGAGRLVCSCPIGGLLLLLLLDDEVGGRGVDREEIRGLH